MSKHICQLRDKNITPIVTWKVVAKVFCKTKKKFLKLCLTGKMFITNALDDSQSLNKKSELIHVAITAHHF